MRRFKLAKISKRRVEVQKVRLKINFGTLLLAFLFACLVWLYVVGSGMKNPASESVETSATAAGYACPVAEAEVDL